LSAIDRVSDKWRIAEDGDGNETQTYCGGPGNDNNGLVGYWNDSVPSGGDLNFTSKAFVYFPPGRYTIVAADDWTQHVYVTFSVVGPPGV
jgi:hypothetical protein